MTVLTRTVERTVGYERELLACTVSWAPHGGGTNLSGRTSASVRHSPIVGFSGGSTRLSW